MSRAPAKLKPSATRDDVARLAGVSAAVVSYVVNGSKRVSPPTEKRVREAIAMLGYKPNRAARALRLGSSETLGMVVPDLTNPFFASLAHAVEQSAGERGYDLLMANSDGSEDLERRHLEQFATRRVDGVFVCSSMSHPEIGMLERADIAAVLLNQYDESPGTNAVGVDLRAGTRLAVEHLAEHGHRSIGIVAGLTSDHSLDAREMEWWETVALLGLSPVPALRQPFSRAGGYQAGLELLSRSERPTALFVSSDRQAIGLLKAMHEGGISVPQDVAIVSFDGSEDAEYSWPPLTTVAQPIDEMAYAAVEALIGGGSDKRHRVFAPTLVRRASCGCMER